jgi:NlpC/P60 family
MSRPIARLPHRSFVAAGTTMILAVGSAPWGCVVVGPPLSRRAPDNPPHVVSAGRIGLPGGVAHPKRRTKAHRLTRPKRSPPRRDPISFALAQVGKSYVYGASGPNAWDCSGLVMMAYGRTGVRLPHQTEAMLDAPNVRRIRLAQLRPGDLVWPHAGHVALYLGRGRIVHAATPAQGVRIDALYAFQAGGRVVP